MIYLNIFIEKFDTHNCVNSILVFTICYSVKLMYAYLTLIVLVSSVKYIEVLNLLWDLVYV